MATMDRIPLALGNSKALFFSNIIQTGGIITAMAGYWLAGLPGFIVGLAVGPAASHLFLTQFIPVRQGEMLWQSARFTLLGGAVGLAAVEITVWLRDVAITKAWVSSVLFFSLLPLLIAAWVAYRRIRLDGQRKITPADIPESAGT